MDFSMSRRKAKYSKAEFFTAVILLLLILMYHFPHNIFFMGVAGLLVGFYFYLLTFKRYSKDFFNIKDHLFIVSTVKYWRLKNKIILGLVLLLIIEFISELSENPVLNMIITLLTPIILLLPIGLGLHWLYKVCKFLLLNIRPSNFVEPIEDVDKMNGYEFEIYLAPIFRSYGYHVEVTKKSGDFGADLILRKSKEKTVVQAKCYAEDKKIGVDAVNEVVGSAGYHNAIKKIVITNRYFTNSAMITAKRNGVTLLNRDDLIRMINQYNNKQIKIS